VRFFFDNCISSNLADAMKLLVRPHHYIEHLIDRFPDNPETEDEIWIPQVATVGDLILVSGDPAITTSAKEKAIWRSSRLTAFFMGGKYARLDKWPQVVEMVLWWPEIVRTAQSAPRGTGYLLPLKGKHPKVIYRPQD
jgi:hypothetical protein